MLDPARPLLMWAAINVSGTRSEWIHHDSIAATRRDARKRYLANWVPEHHKTALKWVRFARVVVSVKERA